MSDDITEQQAEQMLREFADKKDSPQTFFRDVIQSDDTTRTGNLDEEELGLPNLPLRSTKELELFSRDVWGQESWGEYFKKLAEISTSTSLSKDAILIKLAVTRKSEVADVTPKAKKKNSGWFEKRE